MRGEEKWKGEKDKESKRGRRKRKGRKGVSTHRTEESGREDNFRWKKETQYMSYIQ